MMATGTLEYPLAGQGGEADWTLWAGWEGGVGGGERAWLETGRRELEVVNILNCRGGC